MAPAVLILLGCSAGPPVADDAASPPTNADHHIHLQSAFLAHLQDSAMTALGERPADAPASAEVDADQAIAALDSAGVEGALVLSTAYMLGMPEVSADSEPERVRAENEYVAEQVARYPERLVGLCSLHPLRSWAADELERCAADRRIGGLKLHLANSDVSLLDSAQVGALGELFALANRLRLPIVIHLRNRNPNYGAADAEAFIDRVLARAPDIPVMIAHMAGWGGYDEATDAALGTFVEAIKAGRVGGNVQFGLAATVFDPRATGGDTALAAKVTDANRKLAARIRELGIDRVLYGTDWPSWPPGPDPIGKIAANRRLIREALPLEAAELDRVFANVSPIFGWRPKT